MSLQVVGYRIHRWLSHLTNSAMYGVQVKIGGKRGWINVCDGKDNCIRPTMAEAQKIIDEMKAERDADGWKIKVTAQKVCSPSRVRAYKGVHKPRCNDGLGCPECWSKWSAVK